MEVSSPFRTHYHLSERTMESRKDLQHKILHQRGLRSDHGWTCIQVFLFTNQNLTTGNNYSLALVILPDPTITFNYHISDSFLKIKIQTLNLKAMIFKMLCSLCWPPFWQQSYHWEWQNLSQKCSHFKNRHLYLTNGATTTKVIINRSICQ
jgi:hypothetical protein